MDSTSLLVETNRSTPCIYNDTSLASLTKKFYNSGKFQNSQSDYGWRKRVGVTARRKWLSIFSPDLWEVDKQYLVRVLQLIYSLLNFATSFEGVNVD